MIDDYNKDHLPVPSCSTRVIRTGRNKRPYTQLQRRLSKVLFVSIIIILILNAVFPADWWKANKMPNVKCAILAISYANISNLQK